MADIPSIVGSVVGGWVAGINTTIGLINDKFDARQIQTFSVADATALAALSGTYTLAEGDLADQRDTNVIYRYTGSAWALTAGAYPYIEYRLASTQSIGNSADTTIDWDASPTVSVGTWSETTGVITVPLSGYYSLDVLLYWAASATGVRGIHISRNGTADRIAGFDASASVTAISSLSRTTYLAASDTIRVRVFQNSGGALNIAEYYSSGTKTPGLLIRYLGPR